jgi:general secretion pathway protein D
MKSSGGKSSVKVPLLGDIPVLGSLFRSDGEAASRINVVIYLTPYIVRKSDDLQKLRAALMELEDVQTRYNAFIRRALNQRAGIEDSDSQVAPAHRRIRREHTSNLDVLEGKE